MISENEKNKYHSLKAPQELKKRIENDIQRLQTENVNEQSKRSNTMFGSNASPKLLTPNSSLPTKKVIQVLAACLVAVFCIGFVGMGLTSSTVYVNGNAFYGESLALNGNAPALAMSRSSDMQVLEIKATVETEIAVDNGNFTLFDIETGEEIYSGNKYSFKGKVMVQMDLPQGEKAVLTLRNILSEREINFESTGF